MKIEAGKYYKTRDGRKIGPMESYISSNTLHSWKAQNYLWGNDGTSYMTGCLYLDIIEEWVEPQSDKAKLSGETIDMIALDSLKWHMQDGDMEPLQMEAFRIVLRYYGENK
jgi:hypothetical protein